MKVKTSEAVGSIKVLTAFLSKADSIVFHFFESYLHLYMEDNSCTLFKIPISNFDSESISFLVPLSELSNLVKIPKKEQAGFLCLEINRETRTMTQKLDSGLSFSSYFQTLNKKKEDIPVDKTEEIVYVEKPKVDLLYRVLQKQKNINTVLFSSSGFLVTSSKQASFISFQEEEQQSAQASQEQLTSLTAVQLASLRNISEELGFVSEGSEGTPSLLWGYKSELEINSLFPGPCFSFQFELPSVATFSKQFQLDNWKIMKSWFSRETEANITNLTIEKTKELAKLISNSKVSATDPHDLVILNSDESTQTFKLLFYENKSLKNELTFPINFAPDLELALETKTLVVLLECSKDKLEIKVVNSLNLIYSISDLGIHTITATSLTV